MNGGQRNRPVLAVVTSTGEALRFFDGLTSEPLGDLSVTAQPHEIAVDQAAGILYVSHTYRSGVYTDPGEKAHEITVVDPHKREVVEMVSLTPEVAPHGLALDQERGLLYATVEAGPAGGGAVVVLDTATRRQIDRIEVGARGPHWFAITPDGTKGYATNKADPFISVVDHTERTLIGRIPAPYGTEEVAVSPDGHRAYAAGMALHYRDDGDNSSPPPTLLVIDTATDRVIAREPLRRPRLPRTRRCGRPRPSRPRTYRRPGGGSRGRAADGPVRRRTRPARHRVRRSGADNDSHRPGGRPRVRRQPPLGHRARRRPRPWLRDHGPGHRSGRPRHHPRRPWHRLPPLTRLTAFAEWSTLR